MKHKYKSKKVLHISIQHAYCLSMTTTYCVCVRACRSMLVCMFVCKLYNSIFVCVLCVKEKKVRTECACIVVREKEFEKMLMQHR